MGERIISGDIPMVSNEIEFSTNPGGAPCLIQSTNEEVEPEVNQKDVVELLASQQSDVDFLNRSLEASVKQLSDDALSSNGYIYPGSTVLNSVESHEPAWYRTTSLSERWARHLLGMTSHQIVIGVSRTSKDSQETNGQFGIDLYNMLRLTTPVVLAFSASSPFSVDQNEELNINGFQSRRSDQYSKGLSKFPDSILNMPKLDSLDDYYKHLESISQEVKEYLSNGRLDAKSEELYRLREDGAYAPFDRLEPHQIYWMVRPRPDHENEDCVFSIEYRAPDVGVTIQRMQAVNSLVLGLCYFASRNGFDDLNEVLSGIEASSENGAGLTRQLSLAGKKGLDAKLGKGTAGSILYSLVDMSIQGLKFRGFDTQNLSQQVGQVLRIGNDATIMKAHFLESRQLSADSARIFLAQMLYQSLTQRNTYV